MRINPIALKKTVSFLLLFASSILMRANVPQIIPQPQKLTLSIGQFDLRSHVTIVYKTIDQAKNARILSRGIQERTKMKLRINTVYRGNDQIVLQTDKGLENEAYRITIKNKNILCEASSVTGMFYAVQSVLQSIQGTKGNYMLPVMMISDAPRYQWRGLMLDESRHFFGKDQVKKILDVMAHLKMNRFHWHLSDEPAWRIEIKKYPKLTTVGGIGNWDNAKARAQFYTQEDIREIVSYAQERHIMIIPEIDMPGHATAASRAYPKISAGGVGRWAGFTFNPVEDATYQFIDDVFSEIGQLFPAPYIHIGGDEVHYGNAVWHTDPIIQQFIRKNYLKDEIELEHYFVRRVSRIVTEKCSRKVIGWDEIADAGISPKQALVMWWRHDKPEVLTSLLSQKYKVILTPRIPAYFDFVQDSTQINGRRWAGKFCPLDVVYNFPENLDTLIGDKQSQIVGIQATLWTERIADVKRLNYMLYPRLAAIAEDAWTEKSNKDYLCFKKKIQSFYDYLERKGLNYFNIYDTSKSPEPEGPTKADILSEG